MLKENIFGNFNLVIQKLLNIYDITYNDKLKKLITSLITFFREINMGGKFYLKHYSFNLVWEDMVLNHLNNRFTGVRGDKLEFSDNVNTSSIKFKKGIFHPNKDKPTQRIEPDYYYSDENVQYIFDAKYYSDIIKLDYKQIAYYLFLNELDNHERERKTYSALITPTENDTSSKHFEFEPRYNKTYSDLIVLENGMDIKEIMNKYLKT